MASIVDIPRAPLSHREILGLAVPIMLSNVSTPLLGMVDTAIVGRLADPAYIGAAALGGLLFTFVFWGFGFLRMGTTGLTAQALGANDAVEVASSLGRALVVAVGAGVALIILQWPVREAAFALFQAGPRIEGLARGYFDIRIWAAPATLANYALLGWFIGLGRSTVGLVLQLVLNLTNVILDMAFVRGLGWDVRGVALGTLLAEYVAAGVGLALAYRQMRLRGGGLHFRRLSATAALARTLAVNRDIMIRSLALIAVFLWFASQGARRGDVILAANAILLQFISAAAFFLDGIAFATEALVGRAIGMASRAAVMLTMRMTTVWAVATAALLTVAIWASGSWCIEVMTVDAAVRSAARLYLPWAACAPLLGVWAYQLDGLFIGATRTVDMRNAMLASLVVFIMAWALLRPFGNHGLWAAFSIHYAARALTLLVGCGRLVRAIPDARTNRLC